MGEWSQIGHVPFKEKDKIYKEFRVEVDAQFDKLNVDASQRRLDSFKNNLKDMSSQGENKLYREREKLVRAYEHLKSEISTYENNIGFFTSTSKKGGGMIKEMERKIETLKEECKLVEQKINMIDEN
jgi:chromosome segregation ATPase